jgi:Pyruvate phosphate dikinase, AMP/ATP-binding domain
LWGKLAEPIRGQVMNGPTEPVEIRDGLALYQRGQGQPLPAEASGVLFTADPASGRPDRIVVNAAWVLGEALAGGLVTADVLVADAVTGRE